MTDLATNPQGDEAVSDDLDTATVAEGVDTDAQTTDTATDADGEQPDEGQAEAADDSVEVEYEGETLKVPAKVKDALLRQADYTKKTQETAEIKRALEGERQAVQQQAQFHQAFAKEIGEFHALDAQLAQLDPQAIADLAREDPGAAMQYQLQRQALLEQRAALGQSITQKQQAQALEQQRSLATQIEQSRQVLQKEIPGWNDAVYDGLQTFGQQAYGFQAAEIGQVIDPRMIKVLHDAQQWRAHQTKQAAAAKIAKAQQTKPATTVRGQSGQFTASPDTNDFASFEKMADQKLVRA